ncbi:MAG: lipid-A-disaccharide synthase [Candidatus Omnitrophica bacterium]|nr:lipid-A-disaccharide synthase [Candidatus Omnitrophota bacterium]
MENPKKILIVAGEASGDLHASHLVEEIKKIQPRTSFFGLGGPKMKNQGVTLSCDLTKFAVVGFWEVLKNLFKFKKIFGDILKKTDEEKPDLAILVDYPGFNLRLAEELYKKNIPVVYYISPQIWAWGQKRIHLIKKVVKRMLVFFKFEEELYKTHGVPVNFVGNPLLDTVKTSMPKEELLRQAGLKPGVLTVCLLPGSREKEVKALLPIMLKCAKIIKGYLDGRAQFLVLRSSSVKEEIFTKAVNNYSLPIKILTGKTYDGIAASDFALVCSGTATLETAILATPMIILYKVSFLTWLFIRMMIKIPYIGLVNVVKGRKIAEEFVQFDADPEKICDYVIPILHDKEKLARLKLELFSIKPLLGPPGANLRAAKDIVDLLNNY